LGNRVSGQDREAQMDGTVHDQTGEVADLDAQATDPTRAAPSSRGHATALHRIGDETLAFLSLDDLMSELLERVRTILHGDTAVILLVDKERDMLVARAAKGIEEEVRLGVEVPLGHGFAGRVAARAEPIRILDLDRAEVVNPLLRQRGIRSLLGVPLIVEDEVIGVLHVGTLERREFSDEHVEILQLAADRAAAALDRARTAERRTLTQIMQRALLPQALPALPGLRLSGKYLPASSELALGGDWYDVLNLPDGRVGLVIGDVVGRGVEAAVAMSEIRSSLRAYAVERHSPERIVSMLNELLVSMGAERSATLTLLTLDFETDELRSVNAGHPPAVMLFPDGSTELVARSTGPPLGLSAGATYEIEEHSLPPGCRLLLYTDGLIERRGEALEAGLDRLCEGVAIAGQPGPANATLADRVLSQLTRDWEVDDDVAVLAIESIELGPKLSLTLAARATVLSGMRRSLARWLRDNGVPEDERMAIILSCSEGAANAIEHAYGPADAQFTLDGEVVGGEVRIAIADAGEWQPRPAEDRGRGLQIMSALMDDVSVDAAEGGTVVRLAKTIGGGA
jgi:serine phosphatase RsbU (regulator of sigma subunit)/anti-sigma regulatory factor (Ser/Thr protein kinase)